jgi:UDP-3-O-[3-hydroxymyristoyl] N-acetylglucosamine deacetylase
MSSLSEMDIFQQDLALSECFPSIQKTIKSPVTLEGIGLHSGNSTKMQFCPAAENTGIVFRRMDGPTPISIPCHVDYVMATPRSTNIGHNGAVVQTVEHVLSAVYALGISNLIIEIWGDEVPILDGSALPFYKALEKAQIDDQETKIIPLKLKKPVSYSFKDTHLVALPSDTFKISYTLDYPNHKWIGSQFYSFEFKQESFKQEISPCRTFCLYEELIALSERGLIKGGSLDCAVVIKEDGVVNKEGVRFPNEMVRHKVLDLIGDLSLVGNYFSAHVIAIRSGHSSNVALAKEIYNTFKMENC